MEKLKEISVTNILNHHFLILLVLLFLAPWLNTMHQSVLALIIIIKYLK